MGNRTGAWAVVAAVVLTGAALGTEAAPRGPGSRVGCGRFAAAGLERDPLDETQQAAVIEALQDEYRGEVVYTHVLKDHGDARPFSNIVHAEDRHAAYLENLLESRGLPLPENRWADAEVPSYGSRQDACVAAVELETRNVALYDRLLAAGPLPADARQVFEHNRMASLEHHKPAFERCAGGGGRQASGRGVSGRGCRDGGCGRGCGAPGGRGRGPWRGGAGPTPPEPAGSGS